MKRINLFVFSYLLTIVGLFFYSFTQVDLALTLSKASFFQLIEKNFQYLGFFQRPQSATIFLIIIILLFLHFLLFLYLSKKNKLKISNLKILLLLTPLILAFSYNAFSYDLFNYIFDAKIVTSYHLNPYLYKPLDFQDDPMLSFMRWTHRVYPYGPSWLFLTVPLSFIGSNIFLLTFFLFKIMTTAFFVGSSYLIYKISEIVSPRNKIFNTVFWSLNPLVIIEGLVSSHNDIPMIFFGLLTFYFYLKNKKFYSWASYIFSVGVKFSTGVLLPIFLYLFYLDKSRKDINWENIFKASIVLSLLVVLAATLRTNFQPWYLLFPLSLASFISQKPYIVISSITASIFSSSIYIFYVLLTDYAKGYPQIIYNLEITGLILAIILPLLYFLKAKYL